LETLSSFSASKRELDSTGRLADDLLRQHNRERNRPMELFAKLFDNLLVFVYHCFDRIVIHGYLSGLSRPEQVVYFFHEVLGIPVVDKEVLSRRTNDYRDWVEAFARNHRIPIEWAEKGVRKEDHVLPVLRRLVKSNTYGVYFIFKSMEQGRTFRITVPKYPTQDPNFRILAHQRSRFTHYYFYIRDEVLGPTIVRVASFFPFHATYWLNGHSFIERELQRAGIRFHKDDNAFLAVDDVAALQAAADRLSPATIRKQLDYWTLILGPKFSKKERSQMNLSRFYAIAQIEYCDFVPRNKTAIMCPPRLCGVGAGALGLARRRPENWPHMRGECAHSDASHARSASSSRQTGLGPGASFSVGGGSQRRSAASFARTVISAYRLVVSRRTWPSQPRITLTSTPASSRLTAHECRNTCGLIW